MFSDSIIVVNHLFAGRTRNKVKKEEPFTNVNMTRSATSNLINQPMVQNSNSLSNNRIPHSIFNRLNPMLSYKKDVASRILKSKQHIQVITNISNHFKFY